MTQNLKVDIIYYDTSSDFEFEFNLGGCCHSRILNTHTASPKEMVTALSKAVNRSRVILIIGRLQNEDGLFSLISRAIGIPLVDVDNTEFSLKGVNSVISGSLPLVGKDKTLAGCIVESGPQSIILLTEDKSVRKDISSELVFPYISALSRTPDTEGVISDEDKIVAEDEEIDETEQIQDDNVPLSTDDIEELEDNEEIPLFIDIGEDDEDDKVDENEQVIEMNDDFLYPDEEKEIEYNEEESEDYYSDNKKKLSPLVIAILILCGVLFVVVAALLYLIIYTPIRESIPVGEYIKQILGLI